MPDTQRAETQFLNSPDAALLTRVADGDMTAMKALYMAHADAVGRFVRSRVHDEGEVADIVHDTMLKVWRAASGFQGRASVRSWILTLARNCAVDHIRKQSRISLGDADQTLPDDAPDPEAVVNATQEATRLRTCIEGLPERQRSVVHLAFYEDLTFAEISRIESIPEGTVKSRIHHAKKLLMRCLSLAGRK
ncbi:RNA polymerase sigma factor [Thalassococcus sp. S3]|uniref:RNA polymerase sigma factor n=1 Tax=Thalassococcus sp. S3 TaxID=2017482 RepID=UPI0010240D31|nr:RNA polymerase sigma factor [Thalassococcus sp. S3]QBF32635.1 RNA polymerase [Thalassococcus sp. S3]